MRAVIFHGPGQLQVTDVPDPQPPAGGVVIDTAFVGICGSDVRTWRYGNKRVSPPQILGHEVSGVVSYSDVRAIPSGSAVAVCPGVPCGRCRWCARGNSTLCTARQALAYDFPGGMSTSFAVPAASVLAGCVVPLPQTVSLRKGVLAEPLHTVINGQDIAQVGAADSVLVIGLGPIGTLHAAVARSRGALPVRAVDLNPERVAAADRILGEGIAVELAASAAQLRALGPDGGWDVVIVAAGVAAALRTAIDVAAPQGRVLAFAGFPTGKADVGVDMNQLHYRQLSLLGSFGGTPQTFARAVAWLAANRLDAEEFTTVLPMADVESGFGRIEAGVGLKTLLAP
ncbi:MAG: zinc-binding dehydrogenase [Beutenbergiaceae bacterium]